MRLDLGGGNAIQISPKDIQRILHSSPVVAGVTARAQHCMGIANDLAVTSGAEYDMVVQNRSDTTRCRATVFAANFKAVVDDVYHSTLLKAAAQTGSDPRP
jgi:hypothetical protein